jgi:hypothetical protein
MQRNTPATLSPTGVNAAGTLQHIGDYAFYNCSALTNLFGGETGKLIITKTVTTLGRYAFYGCTGFTELSIDIVGVIDNHVFDNCTNLSFLNMGPLMYKVLNVDGVCFVTDEEPIKKDDLRVYRCFPLSRLSCDTLDYVYVGCRESVKVAGMNLKEIAQKIV